MRDWFRRLMMGRYGVDQLTWVLLALSLVISLCGSIFQIRGLSILCWAVLVVCYLRIFSRNIYARQQENQKLLQFWWKLKNKRANRPSREERRKYKVFICPTCKQKLRVRAARGRSVFPVPNAGRALSKRHNERAFRGGLFFDGWDEKAHGGIGGIGSGGLMLLHYFTRWGQSSCFLVSFLAPRQRAPTTARPIAM